MENKERIISISNEGKQFFIYFTGSTYYDEDMNGKKVEREKFYYLDENFNRLIMNGNKARIGERHVMLKSRGEDVIIGPHSPEIETVDGRFIPNTDNNTLGIWLKPTKEDLLKYYDILERQNRERNSIRLG